MNFPQFSLKKRGTGLMLASLALVFLFTGCGNPAGATGGPVSYTPGVGQVLIRLIEAPGNIAPSLNALPAWELYGDGTLLYQSQGTSSDKLLQTQLQPADIAHILDVVVNQDAFFADTKSLYGRLIPDVGHMVLTVHANKRQKTVSLFDEEGVPSEDQHMFSILHFLQSYQPASSHPYAAPGAVVLVRPYARSTTSVVSWPYPDISLQEVAAQECQILAGQGACAATSDPTGYFPIYGKRGADLLNMVESGKLSLARQEGESYVVLAWQLLPDNLVVQPDGKQWVETFGFNGGRWPLLPVLATWDIRSQNRRLKGVVVVKRALFKWMSQVASTGGKSTPLASRCHGWREDRCGVCFPPVAHMLAVPGNLVLALMDLHHVPSARSSASALRLSPTRGPGLGPRLLSCPVISQTLYCVLSPLYCNV